MSSFDLETFAEKSALRIDRKEISQETEVRTKIIDPLLDHGFDWPLHKDDDEATVRLEYTFQDGSRAQQLDYAFLVDGAVDVVLETKSPTSTLGESDCEQLFSYMRTTGALFGILTNGRMFELYISESTRPPREACVTTVELRELPNDIDITRVLQRDALVNGESHVHASRVVNHQTSTEDLLSSDRHIKSIEQELPSGLREELPREPRSYIDDMLTTMQHDLREKQRTTASEPVSPDSTLINVVEKKYFENGSGRVRISEATESEVNTYLSQRSIWPIAHELARKPPYIGIYITDENSPGLKYIASVEKMIDPTLYTEEVLSEPRLLRSQKILVMERVWRVEDYLTDSIDGRNVPQETTLGEFVAADSLDDLRNERRKEY